jgi:transposase
MVTSSEAIRWSIVSSHQQGMSTPTICQKLKVAPKTVRKWVACYKATGGVAPGKSTGRKRLMSHDTAGQAASMLLSGQFSGARHVAAALHLQGFTPHQVSARTLREASKRAAEQDGCPIRAVKGKPVKQLTTKTMQQRLAFAQQHLKREWRSVMFTDRARFHWRHPGTRVQRTAWVRKGTQRTAYQPNTPQCVNVYAGITPYGVTKCHLVAGTSKQRSTYTTAAGHPSNNITKEEYTSVLRDTLLPEGSRRFGSKGVHYWVFQQDNDPAHGSCATTITTYNRRHFGSVELLPNWPPNSPDLNPIEHVWAWVSAKVAAAGFASFDAFKAGVIEAIQSVPKAMLANLYGSMHVRMAEVIRLQGGKTKF